MFFRWVPIIFSSMYDDMAISVYLSTKELISKHLHVQEFQLYHSGTSYAVGFLLGGLIWNVLVNSTSVKRLLLLSQLFMIFFTFIQIFQTAVWHLFIIRFAQGICAGGVFIAINTLVRRNLSGNDFNKFLALNATFVYVVEALIPIIIGFLNDYSLYFSLFFFIALILISIFTNFLDFKDVNEKKSIPEAASKTLKSYWALLSSKLCFIVLIAGITEGAVDVLFNVLDQIMGNCNIGQITKLKNISISILSLVSSASVLIIPFFSPDPPDNSGNKAKFSWKHASEKDKKIMYVCIFALTIIMLLSICNPYTNSYLSTMIIFAGFMICLCVVHYIAVKIMHSVYYSSGCIASTILLSETFFSAILQGSSQFLSRFTDNRFIFGYIYIYILVALFLINVFYRKMQKVNKYKKLEADYKHIDDN